MITSKVLTMYGKMCTNGAEELFRIFKEIPDLNGYESTVRKKIKNPEQMESARPYGPNHQLYLTNSSYQLVFTKNEVTYKIYILSDFEVYLATINNGKVIESEILDAWIRYDEDEEGIWEVDHSGTKKLYQFLKSNKLIKKRTPEIIPRFYQMIDFSELSVTLKKYLMKGVTLSLRSVMYQKSTVIKLGTGLSMIEFLGIDNNQYFVCVFLDKTLMSMESQLLKVNFTRLEPSFSIDGYTLQEIAEGTGIAKWL